MAIESVHDELTDLSNIGEHIDLFFDGRYEATPEARQVLAAPAAHEVISAFCEYLDGAEGAPSQIYAAALGHARKKTGLKGRELFMPVRAALTGRVKGPQLDQVFTILGADTAGKRLRQALKEG